MLKNRFNKIVVAAAAITLVGCNQNNEYATAPNGAPKDRISLDDHFHKASTYVARNTQGETYWVQNLVSNYVPANVSGQPAQLARVEPYKKCRFPAPTNSESFSFAHVSLSENASSLRNIPNSFLRERAAEMIKIEAREGIHQTRLVPPKHTGLQFKVADVILTDTSKPLYLVLGAQDETVFNFTVAAGVEISKVIILGNKAVGYANLPPETRIAVLGEQEMRACGAKLAFNHDKDARIWKRLKARDTKKFRSSYSKAQSHAIKFHRWFKQAFSQSPVHKITDITELAHILIGPAPTTGDSKPIYKPLTSANIRVVSNADVFFADKQQYPAIFAAKLDGQFKQFQQIN